MITTRTRLQLLAFAIITLVGVTFVGARYAQRLGAGNTAVWRVGIDNIANQRAWKEAPYQYGHAYLYPLAPRALHASVAVNF